MKDTNAEKAREISKRWGEKYEDDQFRIVADSRPDCYAAAKEMAEAKDRASNSRRTMTVCLWQKVSLLQAKLV